MSRTARRNVEKKFHVERYPWRGVRGQRGEPGDEDKHTHTHTHSLEFIFLFVFLHTVQRFTWILSRSRKHTIFSQLTLFGGALRSCRKIPKRPLDLINHIFFVSLALLAHWYGNVLSFCRLRSRTHKRMCAIFIALKHICFSLTSHCIVHGVVAMSSYHLCGNKDIGAGAAAASISLMWLSPHISSMARRTRSGRIAAAIAIIRLFNTGKRDEKNKNLYTLCAPKWYTI